MNTTLYLTYDGETLRSDEPLELEVGARIKVTVEAINPTGPTGKPYSFFHTARKMNLDGPPDLSARLHDYLYGEPCDSKE